MGWDRATGRTVCVETSRLVGLLVMLRLCRKGWEPSTGWEGNGWTDLKRYRREDVGGCETAWTQWFDWNGTDRSYQSKQRYGNGGLHLGNG